MIQKIVAVRDRQLNAFLRPFAAATLGQAIRSFADEVNRKESELNKHPQDYELYHIADWDEQSGTTNQYAEEGCPEHGGRSLPYQVALASNLLEQK